MFSARDTIALLALGALGIIVVALLAWRFAWRCVLGALWIRVGEDAAERAALARALGVAQIPEGVWRVRVGRPGEAGEMA